MGLASSDDSKNRTRAIIGKVVWFIYASDRVLYGCIRSLAHATPPESGMMDL